MKQAFAENPAVCAPLTGRKLEDLLEECRNIIPKKPDIIEWRADFFDDLAKPEQLLHALSQLRDLAGDMPILFTVRSSAEGGNANLNLSAAEKKDIYQAVCRSKQVEYMDVELAHSYEDIQEVKEFGKSNGVKLILSYHNFQTTPDEAFIKQKLKRMEEYGADIAKIAVMPNSLEDVLDFMKTTLMAQEQIGIPMIAISMGELGLITRLFGWMFGSQLTFAVGENVSAPGQIPIGDVKSIIGIVRKSQAVKPQ